MDNATIIEGTVSYQQIAAKCIEYVPGWTDLRPDDISISPMLEGLSNLLYKVERPAITTCGQQHVDDAEENPSFLDESSPSNSVFAAPLVVLFRVYGLSVTSFYDSDLELTVFRTMSSFNYGPRMYAHGAGWRIEEYYQFHRVVQVHELRDSRIYLQVARKLGALHQVWRSSEFPITMKQRKPICFTRLDNWTSEALKALQQVTSQASPVGSPIYEIPEGILHGIDSMKHTLTRGFESGTLGFHVVFGHGDIQENNLMVLRGEDCSDLRLIDFEYADMNLQGADIGNFFGEFTMDYIVSEGPMFTGDNTKYPPVELQEDFCSAYLEVYFGRPAHKEEIGELMQALHTFRQLSNLLWGMWAIIRSKQNADTKFGLFEYAKFRFDTFLNEVRSD